MDCIRQDSSERNSVESSSGVFSNADNVERNRSSSGGSTVSTNSCNTRHLPSHLHQLLNHLPHNVRDTTWEIRNELAKKLDPLKNPIGNDWRLVASRLGFTVEVIDTFSKTDNPTMEMMKLCDTTSTEELFGIIQDIQRVDIIEDLLRYLGQGRVDNNHCLPTQESLDDDKSSMTHPLEESSSDISKLCKQPSEQGDDDADDLSKFLSCQQSKEFWMNIPGSYDEKKWPDFLAAMNKACPEESAHGGIDRFVCHIFKIDYDERQDGVVRLVFYLRLLAFFGPMKPFGCFSKMYDLIVKSVSRSMDGKKHSWFAGYMNKENAENKLQDQTPGTFIVRFSGSKVEEGWFVLAVRTLEDVVQIQIEKDKIRNELLLAGESFPDLLAVVSKLRREIILKDCRQLLINPCPDLPLNTHFISYAKATRNKVGRGRARPR